MSTLTIQDDALVDTEKSDCGASGLSFIEQLHAIAQIDCSKPNRVWVTGINHEARSVFIMRPPCRVWACPECGARNAKRWIARIINGVNQIGGKWFMFTVTAHEKWRGHERSIKNLRQGWKKLYNRMRRKFGTSQYCKVWEAHKDGSFHLHGLIDTEIPTRWLKDNSRACGMGYQVEIHHVDNAGQVAGYIAKYSLKSSEFASVYKRGMRRIEVSRNFPKLPDPKSVFGDDWKWQRNHTATGVVRTVQPLFVRGYNIQNANLINKAIEDA